MNIYTFYHNENAKLVHYNGSYLTDKVNTILNDVRYKIFL